jgi:hypothetical protein
MSGLEKRVERLESIKPKNPLVIKVVASHEEAEEIAREYSDDDNVLIVVTGINHAPCEEEAEPCLS